MQEMLLTIAAEYTYTAASETLPPSSSLHAYITANTKTVHSLQVKDNQLVPWCALYYRDSIEYSVES